MNEVSSKAPKRAKSTDIVGKTKTVNIGNPSSVMDFSKNLKDIIVQNNLYTNVKGKNYVNVEGWQIAGAFLGLFPVVDKVEDLSTDSLIKYRAEVHLSTFGEENVIGRGMAICTNREQGKQKFEEYAIASMAQTRAIGKAFRMTIGWLMKLAGYEPTPTEEMVDILTVDGATMAVSKKEIEKNNGQLEKAIDQALKATTIDELEGIWRANPEIRKVKTFFDTVKMRKANLARESAQNAQKNSIRENIQVEAENAKTSEMNAEDEQ